MAAEKKRAEKTSFIIGDMTGDTPITKRADMIKRRFAATSFSHDEDSEKQQSESLRGSDTDVFGEDGFLWGSGGMEMEVPLLGALEILRHLLRDKTPVSRAIPDKVLVASGTDVSDILADGYFTATGNETINLVNAQNLTGDGAKTIARGISGYTTALTLTVTPDSAADLTDANTPGTVVITYRGTDGLDKTLSLSFPNATKTTAQTVSLPANAEIMQVRTTGWNAGTLTISTPIARKVLRNPEINRPGKLRFKFSAANAGGSIVVRGNRKVGLASTDTLPMKETFKLSDTDADTMDVTLTKYFHKINKVEVKDSSGDAVSTGTVEVLSTPGGYETFMKMSKDILKLMMEAEVGGIPRRITRLEFISGQLNIAATVRLVIDMLSKRVDKRATIEGGDDEKFVATAAEHPTEFPFTSEKFFPDWGGYLELDNEAFVFNDATVDINRNEDFSEGKRASRFRADLDSDSRRQVTCQINGDYISGETEADKFVRWDQKFRNNEAVNARIANYHWPTSGRQYSLEWFMPYCEVTSPVRVEANSPGTIPITIDLKAVPNPSAPAGTTEFRLKLVSDDRYVP